MKYAIVAAVWILVLIGTTLIINNAQIRHDAKQREIAASDSVRKQTIIDSLTLELFEEQTTNGRYELGLEHLKEIDSVKYNEVIKFIEHETE